MHEKQMETMSRKQVIDMERHRKNRKTCGAVECKNGDARFVLRCHSVPSFACHQSMER